MKFLLFSLNANIVFLPPLSGSLPRGGNSRHEETEPPVHHPADTGHRNDEQHVSGAGAGSGWRSVRRHYEGNAVLGKPVKDHDEAFGICDVVHARSQHRASGYKTGKLTGKGSGGALRYDLY